MLKPPALPGDTYFAPGLFPGSRSRHGDIRRTFQLDSVSFGIRDINGRSLPLRAITRFDGPRLQAMLTQMVPDLLGIERLNPQAEMIEIACLFPRRRPAFAPQGSIDGHQINQRRTSP